MRIGKLLLAMLWVFGSPAFAQHEGQHGAQPRAVGEHQTFSQIQDLFVSAAENTIVPLAEAMPEDKYSFAPTNGQFKGVRTFSEQIKHVAASNYGLAAAILERDLPIKLETQADLDAISGKAQTVKFLKDSFEFLHKAASIITEKNAKDLIKSPDSPGKPLSRIEVAERATSHCWNHYGQLVEYLRMSGLTPPVPPES